MPTTAAFRPNGLIAISLAIYSLHTRSRCRPGIYLSVFVQLTLGLVFTLTWVVVFGCLLAWETISYSRDNTSDAEDRFDGSQIYRTLQAGKRLACGGFGLAWVDRRAAVGDHVVKLTLCANPVVLRRRLFDDGFVLVGDTIVVPFRPDEPPDVVDIEIY